jgi:hypothetical protein
MAKVPSMGPDRGSLPNLFGDDDLTSPRAIREYLNRVRRVSRKGAQDIEDDSEVLFSIIANSKGIPILMGADMRRKGHHIVEPLREASNAYSAAARLSVLTWQRFHKHFGEAIEAAGSKRKSGRQMDWSDS